MLSEAAAVFFLAAGLGLLILGAEGLVRGAAGIARRFGVSELVIGLTLVAFGTSTPEFVVSFFAAIEGKGDVSVGNAMGSNVFNMLFILGVCALLKPLTVARSLTWKEIPFSLLAALAVGAAGNDAFLSGEPASTLSRGDGLLFLGFFLIFLVTVLYAPGASPGEGETPDSPRSVGMSVLLAAGGLGLLVLGADWTLDGAVTLARFLGVSEGFIAATLIAGGTSLPELATSVVAARRGALDIAVGNVVGSNIFNALFILGVSSLVRPLSFSPGSDFDVLVASAASLFLFFAMFMGSRHRLDRWEGALFLAAYAAYVGGRLVLDP